MSILKEHYYHLSKTPKLKELDPCVPYKLNTHAIALENNTIERVSLAPSIEQCILGIQPNDKDFDKVKYLEYYCYINHGPFYGLSNNEIIKNKYVFDAHITNEVWALKHLSVDYFGKVLVYKDVLEEIIYTPILPDGFNNWELLREDKTLITYRRKYELIQF